MVRGEKVDAEDTTQLIPVSSGQIDGHNFVLSLDMTGTVLVQFEEGAVGFNVGQMLGEAHNRVYGYIPDEDEVEEP